MINSLLFGATGLIGSHLAKEFNNDSIFGEFACLGRRRPKELGGKGHFYNWPEQTVISLAFQSTHAFCSLGTTIKEAGGKDNFRKIDFDLVIQSAQTAKNLGCQHFFLVSSHGANAHSLAFYLKIKGQAEEALKRIGFISIHFFRPSFLLGEREKPRLGEQIIGSVLPILSPLFIGPISDIRPIHAKQVSHFMCQVAKNPGSGVFFHSSSQIASAHPMKSSVKNHNNTGV